jgi:hypothetical protein
METHSKIGMPERRRHPRTQLQMTLRCIRLDPDGGDVVDSLSLFDISRSGLGAYCDRPFYPGQRLVLCLPLTGSNGRRNIYGTVTRCRPTEDGYRVGMVFDRVSLGEWAAAHEVSVAA